MIAAVDRSLSPRARAFGLSARPFEIVGGGVLRYGLVLLLFGIGLLKFTEPEARAIEPLIAGSPILSWLYAVTSVQGASALLGIVELILGALLAISRWRPRLSLAGSLGASVMFLITLSFLFTTRGLSSDMQGFLMKDLILFGAAIWTAGDALRQAEGR